MSEERKLKIVTQEHPVGCGVACAAMVAGVTYAEAAEKAVWDPDVGMSPEELNATLDALGVKFERLLMPEFRRCVLHIMSVPSLNVVAGMHYVVVDMRDGLWTVLDPQRGMPGKKYYISHVDDEDPIPGVSYLVKSYAEVIETTRKGEG